MGYFKDVTPESVGISSKGIMKFLDRNKIKSNYIVLWCSAMDSVRQRDGGNHMMKNSAIRCIRSANH